MVFNCPKCGRNVPDESVYCPYCGHGIGPSAKTSLVSAGGTLMFVAATASLIIFILAVRALMQIYTWYPPGVASGWIVYDQGLTVFSFIGFVFGLSGGILSLARRSYRLTMASAVICTLAGAGNFIISMIIPYAQFVYSLLYYFLPVFTSSLIATVLFYPREAEFKSKPA